MPLSKTVQCFSYVKHHRNKEESSQQWAQAACRFASIPVRLPSNPNGDSVNTQKLCSNTDVLCSSPARTPLPLPQLRAIPHQHTAAHQHGQQLLSLGTQHARNAALLPCCLCCCPNWSYVTSLLFSPKNASLFSTGYWSAWSQTDAITRHLSGTHCFTTQHSCELWHLVNLQEHFTPTRNKLLMQISQVLHAQSRCQPLAQYLPLFIAQGSLMQAGLGSHSPVELSAPGSTARARPWLIALKDQLKTEARPPSHNVSPLSPTSAFLSQH